MNARLVLLAVLAAFFCAAQDSSDRTVVVGSGYALTPPLDVAPGQLLPVSLHGLDSRVYLPALAPPAEALPNVLAGISGVIWQGSNFPLPLMRVAPVRNCETDLLNLSCAAIALVIVQIPFERRPEGRCRALQQKQHDRVHAHLAGQRDVHQPVVVPWPNFDRVVAGDVNGDGKAELILYRPADGTLYVGFYPFAESNFVYNLVAPDFFFLVAGDFTGDGKADLLLYNPANADPWSSAYVGASTADGKFAFAAAYNFGRGFDTVLARDVTGDVLQDIVLYNSRTGELKTGVNSGSSGSFRFAFLNNGTNANAAMASSPAGGFLPVVSCAASSGYGSGVGVVHQLVTFSASSNEPFVWSGAVNGTTSPASFFPSAVGGYRARVTATSNHGFTAMNYCEVSVAEAALSEFRACLISGSQTECVLPPKPGPAAYLVPPPVQVGAGSYEAYLTVKRPRIIITGATADGVILRRGYWPGFRSSDHILFVSGDANNATIRRLTLDGNRYGARLSCLSGNAPFWDLEVAGANSIVEYVNFINAPGTAALLTARSLLWLSWFGQGSMSGAGIGPELDDNGVTAEESATRSTAIYASGAENWVHYNQISHAGTAGITLKGSNGVAYGNWLYKNRYEISDGSGGGQLTLESGSSSATVTGNLIDGAFWPNCNDPLLKNPPQELCSVNDVPTPAASGCIVRMTEANSGIEAYGTDHTFGSNDVRRHSGGGMQFAGSELTERVTITSESTDPNDPPRWIEQNQAGGIGFIGYGWCRSQGIKDTECKVVKGVKLDAPFVRSNPGVGIGFDGAKSLVGFEGFVAENGSCMNNNILNVDPGTEPNELPYKQPNSYVQYRGRECPTGPAPTTPARSYVPGWIW